MAGTKTNVLVGVATLSVREPNDAIAEWSTTQKHAGDYSVRLYKKGSGNDGSTHVELIPPTGITMTAWTAGIVTNSFWHHSSAVVGNFAQMEFRFEDPNSDAWAELTVLPLQTYLGTAVWVQTILANATLCGYGGHTELDTPFFVWGPPIAANLVKTAITALDGGACAPEDWILSRVRLELWESAPQRTQYIDTVQVMGVTYAIEPGATTPGLSLSSPYTEVGYTEDGVILTYTADEADIDVEEETFAIGRVITKETLAITCNMAETSLFNINKAMAGSVLSGSIITLGTGVNKTMNLKLEGTNPAGFHRAIQIPLATATGAVGMSYRKGTKTVIPVTFQALKGDSPVVTIVDNVA